MKSIISRVLLPTILLGTLFIAPSGVIGQSERLTTGNPGGGLQLFLFEHTQEPRTKLTAYDLIITSSTNTDRVLITVDVGGPAVLESFSSKEIGLRANESHTERILVQPRGQGRVDISVTAEAFEAEGTYVAAVDTFYGVLADGTRIPQTGDYTMALIIMYVRFGLIVLGVLAVLIIGGVVIGLRVKKMLDADDEY